MVVYAIVPLKGLSASKKRLSTILNPQERKKLTIAMLEDVLIALQNSTVEKTVIISNDSTVRDLAAKFGASYLAEKTHSLNSAIEEATEWCLQKGAEAVLVLPADIPLLSTKDVDKIIELGDCEEQIVVLSPSSDGGTNALFQSPPNLIQASFGPRSFSKHLKEANSRRLNMRLYHSTGVATDIDSAEDLNKLLKTENQTNCRKILDQLKLSSRLNTKSIQPKKL